MQFFQLLQRYKIIAMSGVVFSGVGTLILSSAFDETSNAQSNNSDVKVEGSPNAIAQGGVGNKNINNSNGKTIINGVTGGEINIIQNYESERLSGEGERALLDRFIVEFIKRIESGELIATQGGAQSIISSAADIIKNSKITKNVITTRQFSIPWRKTHHILGTNHSVTYTYASCGGSPAARLMINGKRKCLTEGERHELDIAGDAYYLIFETFGPDKGSAEFALLPKINR